ncbi:MAG TPA: J domain-containing protein [Chloroflexota bacterium]|nr:J domain-containing protein [Chloroflexota bacterium]
MPRRSKRAADEEAATPANGTVGSPPDALGQHLDGNGSSPVAPGDPGTDEDTGTAEPPNSAAPPVVALATNDSVAALATVGPRLEPDPGLYAVLGLDPSASDEEIQTTYRRLAARLLGGGPREHAAMRQLNVAYEVLGTRVRRDEYDRLRQAQLHAPGAPPPIQAGAKAPTRVTRRRRPRHVVQPNHAGFSYVFVVLIVVGLAAAAALFILPRLSINLSALNALQSVLPLPNPTRPAVSATATPSATAVPTATTGPGVAARFAGSAVSVSNANPAQNTVENVVVKLRRDGRPATSADVWAIARYSTTDERWPATGTVKTDDAGEATISFNIGRALPDHAVTVEVFAQVDDQQYSWSTTFTPH